MAYEDQRTTITLPGELLKLIDELRTRGLLPRGRGLRKDNPITIWLATEYAKRILAEQPTEKIGRKK